MSVKKKVLIAVGVVVALVVVFFVFSGISAGSFDKHYLLALSHLEKNDYDLALSELNKATAGLAGFADGFLLRGDVYRAQGEYDKAIEDYNKGMKMITRLFSDGSQLKPNERDAWAYNGRGLAHVARSELAEALADFTEAAKFVPENATYRENVEFVQQQMN